MESGGWTTIIRQDLVPNDPALHRLHRSITSRTLSHQDTLDRRKTYNWCNVTTGGRGCPYLSRITWMACYLQPQEQYASINPLISQSPLRQTMERYNLGFVTDLPKLMVQLHQCGSRQVLEGYHHHPCARTLCRRMATLFLNNIWNGSDYQIGHFG